ncbi:MAG: DUF2520 domain-containing protein [Candidatus Dormibacteria bacterium]
MTETEAGIGIVGAGRAGGALARQLSRRGTPPEWIHSRTPARARRLAAEVGARTLPTAAEVLRRASLTLLAVPESPLPELAQGLSEQLRSERLRGHLVAHLAGRLGPEVLRPLANLGMSIGVFHPLAPIPDGDPDCLEGTYVSIEAAPAAARRLRQLARQLGCRPFQLGPADRALYHAAAVLAGVLPVELEGLGERLARQAGGGRDLERGLRALYAASARNVMRLGPERGLSGPLARGEQPTVDAHLRALARAQPELAGIYAAIEQAARREPADH